MIIQLYHVYVVILCNNNDITEYHNVFQMRLYTIDIFSQPCSVLLNILRDKYVIFYTKLKWLKYC